MQSFRVSASVSLATSVTTTAARALPSSAAVIRFYNASATACWVEFGKGTVVAAIPADGTVDFGGIMLAPNEVVYIEASPGLTHYAAILASGTGVLHAATGD